MLCQAAPPDYLLCCVPCDLAVGNFLEMLSDDFSHRLGAAISRVCVSNFIVDSARSSANTGGLLWADRYGNGV